MGATTTQNRFLANLPGLSKVYSDGRSPYYQPNPVPRPSQSTTSYRTSREKVNTLSAEDIRDFTTVTYNALQRSNPTYDTGHEFYTTKTSVSFSHPDWKVYKDFSTYRETRKGPLILLTSGVSSFGVPPAERRLSSSEVSSYGGRAIKATQPTKSAASLTTFLGELFQAIPSVIGMELFRDRTSRYRSMGSEYLNVQFGWAPFVSDIKGLMHAVKNCNSTIQQYQRDSGRVVRRRFSFPTETWSSLTENVQKAGYATPIYFYNGDNPKWNTDAGTLKISLENTGSRNIWFSGAFEYYLTKDEGLLSRLERYSELADKILGSNLTPEVLWELAPWSWLVDWVTNIGDVIANASAFSSNGLVMKYGYLMCHTREFNRYIIPDGATFFRGIKTGPISNVFFRETKERKRATPYGFSVDPGDFSLFQWSILGALGLTKAPGILH